MIAAIRTLVGYRATRKPSIHSVHLGISVQEGEGGVPLGTKVWGHDHERENVRITRYKCRLVF